MTRPTPTNPATLALVNRIDEQHKKPDQPKPDERGDAPGNTADSSIGERL